MTKRPAPTVQSLTDAALDAMNAGFSSKAAQKRALDDVNRAYGMLDRDVQDACLLMRDADNNMSDAVRDIYYNLPSYPHAFKAKHAAALRSVFPFGEDVTLNLESLAELCNVIKASVITPPASPSISVFAARVIETIAALMARRTAQFNLAFDLTEVFGDKVRVPGFSCRTHFVTNAHGTQFLRTFYYLYGQLTPLNSIIAGVEAKMRAEAA
jgi:hypothetical protein